MYIIEPIFNENDNFFKIKKKTKSTIQFKYVK